MQFPMRNRKRKSNRIREMARPNPWLSRCRSEFNEEEEEEGRRNYANCRSVEENQDILGFKEIIDIKDEEEEEEDDVDLQLALFHSSSIGCSRNKDKGKSPEPAEIIDLKKKGIVEQSLTLVHRKWGHDEAGESSVAHCVICNDIESSGSILRANSCGHPFCEDCIRNYIKDKLHDDIFVIECPEAKCKQVLEQTFWQQFIPERLAWILEHALIEASVLEIPLEFRCPFKDCLEPFVDDERNFLIMACPNCWKIFCRCCMVSWHKGMTCHEFQRLRLKLKRQQTLRELQLGAEGARQLFIIIG